MSAKPTDGEWILADIPDHGEDCTRVLMVHSITKDGRFGEIVAYVGHGEECDEPETIVNGNLLAAAKEMRAELKRDLEFVSRILVLLRTLKQTETVQYHSAQMRKAGIESVLAKAEGKKS